MLDLWSGSQNPPKDHRNLQKKISSASSYRSKWLAGMRKSKLSSMYRRELQVQALVAKSCDISTSVWSWWSEPTPCVQRHPANCREVFTAEDLLFQDWTFSQAENHCRLNTPLAWHRLWIDSRFRLFSPHEWPRYVHEGCEGSKIGCWVPRRTYWHHLFQHLETRVGCCHWSRQTTQWLAQTQCLGAQSAETAIRAFPKYKYVMIYNTYV